MIYAIGDIHGCYMQFVEIYEKILEDIEECGDEENHIIGLGDYIDRGPESKAVLDFIFKCKDSEKIKHTWLMGNHEEMFIKSLLGETKRERDQYYHVWLYNGGVECKESFGYRWNAPLAESGIADYIRKLKEILVPFVETPDYVFVHGGYKSGSRVKNNPERVLYWSRMEELDAYSENDKIVIHGHTPNKPHDLQIDKNRINVDSGANWSGVLTCVRVPNINLNNPEMPDYKIMQTDNHKI